MKFNYKGRVVEASSREAAVRKMARVEAMADKNKALAEAKKDLAYHIDELDNIYKCANKNLTKRQYFAIGDFLDCAKECGNVITHELSQYLDVLDNIYRCVNKNLTKRQYYVLGDLLDCAHETMLKSKATASSRKATAGIRENLVDVLNKEMKKACAGHFDVGYLSFVAGMGNSCGARFSLPADLAQYSGPNKSAQERLQKEFADTIEDIKKDPSDYSCYSSDIDVNDQEQLDEVASMAIDEAGYKLNIDLTISLDGSMGSLGWGMYNIYNVKKVTVSASSYVAYNYSTCCHEDVFPEKEFDVDWNDSTTPEEINKQLSEIFAEACKAYVSAVDECDF